MKASNGEAVNRAISLRGFSKTFPGTKALADVNLELRPGEVHALIGQNGSGKSTLFKILAGIHAPDPGAGLTVRGTEVSLPIQPADLPRLGFSFVHQDLGLALSMSVLENMRAGYFATGRLGRIRWKDERLYVKRVLEDFGVGFDPSTPAADLSQAERAIIAIVRALQVRSGEDRSLLVLDEPTAYLPPPDIARVFEAVRKLRASGVPILFTTHRLDEVKELADRASVLRDGRLVGTYAVDQVSERDLITALIGQDLGELYPDPPPGASPQVVLSAHGLCRHPVKDASFELRRGEVLGLTGLVGMGHDEVLDLLYGARTPARGEIEIDGERYPSMTPRRALELGLGLLPANRQRDSGIPQASLKENVTMPVLGHRYFKGARLRHARERTDVASLLRRFEVRPSSDPDRLLATLSGGNQQKALLGKWMQIPNLRALLLHEPTQGVDIGSRKSIFEFIREAAAAGTAVVLATAEYEDLAHLCDRVLVMRYGEIVSELSGADLTEERIVHHCYQTEAAAVG